MLVPYTYDSFGGSAVATAPQSAAARPPDHSAIDRQALDGRGMLVPHYQTFQGIYNLFSKTYSYRFDEAVRHGLENARSMRNDTYFRGLLQERLGPLGRWKWEVAADPDPLNPKDPYSADKETVGRMLTAEAKATPDLMKFRRHLGWCAWYGRAANQVAYARNKAAGLDWNPMVPVAWEPTDGDKLLYSWDGDGHWCVLINPTVANNYPGETTTTDRSTALRLRRPDYRSRWVVATHEIEDAPYEDYLMAGRAKGVGLRDFVYWGWWLRDEMLSWMVNLAEKAGTLGLLMFTYPAGNAAAEEKVKENAANVNNRNVLIVPVQPGTKPQDYDVKVVSLPTEGLRFLKEVTFDYFDRHFERLFVGQTLSAGTEGSGLGGGGVADLHEDTKYALLEFDAINQAECLTRDFVAVLKGLNHADAPGVYRWNYLLPDPKAKDKLEAITKAASLPGKKLEYKADDVRKLVGMAKPEEGDETVGGDDPQQMGMGAPAGAAGDDPQPGQPEGSAVLSAALAQAAHDGDQDAIDGLTELAGDPAGLDGLLDDLTHDEAGADARQYAPGGTQTYAWSEGSTRNGHVKAVGSGEHGGQTLYGEKAEAALRGRKKGKEEGPSGGRGGKGEEPTGGREGAGPEPVKALASKLLDHVRQKQTPPQSGESAGRAGRAGPGRAKAAGATGTPKQPHEMTTAEYAASNPTSIPPGPSTLDSIAQHLRDAMEEAVGNPKDQCIACAYALKSVYPEAKIFEGVYSGEPHTLAQLGGKFIDVTADQFDASDAVQVLDPDDLPREYWRFKEIPDHLHPPSETHWETQDDITTAFRSGMKEDLAENSDFYHGLAVEDAAAAGVPVPERVLAGYPTLAEKYGLKPENKAGTGPAKLRDRRGRKLDTEFLDRARAGDKAVSAEMLADVHPDDKAALERLLATPAGGTTPRPGSTAKERLARSPVVKSTTLGGGINETRLIDLEDGGKGVFKPAAGESEGLRLGVPAGTYYKREAAVSAVADALGFGDLVPPTTVRDVGGQTGSVQEFATGAKVAAAVGGVRGAAERAKKYDGDADAARAAVLDYVTGHCDRHMGNWLLANPTPENPAGKLVLIDNGLALPTAYHSADYFNHTFASHAKERKLPVPPEAADLAAKWPDVEKELKAAGIEDEAISLTRERLDAVAAHAGKPFADLPAFWAGGDSPIKAYI